MSTLMLIGGLVVILALIGQSEGHTVCENDHLTCEGSETRCDRDTGKCVCKGTRIGIPHLGCLLKKYKYCNLVNDPEGKPFSRQPEAPVDLPMPCGYLVADWESEGKAGKITEGLTCTGKIYATERQLGNKFYISGISLRMVLTRTVGLGEETTAVQLDAFAEATNGVYRFDMRHDGGPSVSDTVDLGSLNDYGYMEMTSVEAERVKIQIDACGLLLYFRPADAAKTVWQQEGMPGLIVGLNKGDSKISYNVQKTFCLSANADVNRVKDEYNFNNFDDAFIFRAFMSDAPSDLPGFSEQAADSCEKATRAVRQCKNQNVVGLPGSMTACNKLLLHSPFVQCYNRGNEEATDLINLFRDCMRCLCQGETDRCTRARGWIMRRGCHVHLSGFQTFMVQQ